MRNNFPSVNALGGAVKAWPVTPGNNPLTELPRALWVGTGGDVSVTMDGEDVTFTNVPDGTMLMVRPSHVLSSTTASDIVAVA